MNQNIKMNQNNIFYRLYIPESYNRKKIFNLKVVNKLIDLFWDKKFNLKKNRNFSCQVLIKIMMWDGRERTLSMMRIININDKELYMKFIESYYHLKNTHYSDIKYDKMYIQYRFIPTQESNLRTAFANISSSSHPDLIPNISLPRTMDLSLWHPYITDGGLGTITNYTHWFYTLITRVGDTSHNKQ